MFGNNQSTIIACDAAALFIDKIMLRVPKDYVNVPVAETLLNTKPLHFFMYNHQNIYLVIHCEYFPDGQSHMQRIWAALIDLTRRNAITGSLAECAIALDANHCQHGTSECDHWMVDTLKSHKIKPYELEVTFDFFNEPAVSTVNYDHFTPFGSGEANHQKTFYSRKDYGHPRNTNIQVDPMYPQRKLKTTRQNSFIIIYDAGTKHKLDKQTQRIEFKFTGRYADNVSIDLFVNGTAGLYRALLPTICKELWFVTDPHHFNFYGYIKMNPNIWWVQELLRMAGWDNYTFVYQKLRKKR